MITQETSIKSTPRETPYSAVVAPPERRCLRFLDFDVVVDEEGSADGGGGVARRLRLRGFVVFVLDEGSALGSSKVVSLEVEGSAEDGAR